MAKKEEKKVADKAYDTEPIRRCINKELGSTEQIPLKSNFTHGVYRRKSQKTFQKEIYNQRGLVENVFSVIKRIFKGTNKSKSTRLRNKETSTENTGRFAGISQTIKRKLNGTSTELTQQLERAKSRSAATATTTEEETTTTISEE